jgi:hypothetical protein
MIDRMDRRTLGLVAAGLVIGFLLGFIPEMIGKRHAQRDLDAARLELRLSRDQGRLGAAMAEALRSNYERSRQLMAGVFTDLQSVQGQVQDARKRQALTGVLSQRDEIITLLSRGQPESAQRLMILYTQVFAVLDPQGTVAPAVTTAPAPPAQPSAAPVAPPPAKPAGAKP